MPESKGILFYRRYERGEAPLDTGRGRVANAFSKAVIQDRTPSLFDEEEIKNRDNALKELQALKKTDDLRNIERKGKPVVLTSYQCRILLALSYALTQDLEADDIKAKIADPKAPPVSRVVDVTALTHMIFNSTRKRYKDSVIKGLSDLAEIKQVQIFGDIKLTRPLINIGDTMEDLSPDKRNNTDFINVTFGGFFLYNVDKRFSPITPKLFRVWEKSGRSTELFHVLLNSLFAVYWQHKEASKQAEERIRHNKKSYANAEEIKEAIAEAKRNAMAYELNVDSIKKRLSTSYETRDARKKFWLHLDNAIDGFKELDIIKEAIIQRGVRGQEKVIFILSETYTREEQKLLPLS